MSLGQLIILEGQFEDFLARSAFGLRRLFPVILVHAETCLHLCCCRSDTSIVFVDRLNVFLIALGLLLLVAPKVLDFGLVLVLPNSEVSNFGIQIFDLRCLPLYRVTLLLQLGLQRLLLFSEATFQSDYLLFKVFHLTRVHLFPFIKLHLFRLNLT